MGAGRAMDWKSRISSPTKTLLQNLIANIENIHQTPITVKLILNTGVKRQREAQAVLDFGIRYGWWGAFSHLPTQKLFLDLNQFKKLRLFFVTQN